MSENKKRRADEEVLVTKPVIRYAIEVCYDGPYNVVMISGPIDHPSVKRIKAALRTLAPLDHQADGPVFSQFLAARLVDVIHELKVEPVTLEMVQCAHTESTRTVIGKFDPIDPHTLITNEDRRIWWDSPEYVDTQDEPTILYQLATIGCAF